MTRFKAIYTVYQEDGKYPSKAFRSRSRLWRWRLTNQNGHIVADGGEGYSKASNALRAVKRNLALHGINVSGPGWRARISIQLGIMVTVKD